MVWYRTKVVWSETKDVWYDRFSVLANPNPKKNPLNYVGALGGSLFGNTRADNNMLYIFPRPGTSPALANTIRRSNVLTIEMLQNSAKQMTSHKRERSVHW